MLVLTRKSGEKVRINDDILVTVDYVGQGRVKLLFTAPKGVKIHREEVYQQIQEEMREVPK